MLSGHMMAGVGGDMFAAKDAGLVPVLACEADPGRREFLKTKGLLNEGHEHFVGMFADLALVKPWYLQRIDVLFFTLRCTNVCADNHRDGYAVDAAGMPTAASDSGADLLLAWSLMSEARDLVKRLPPNVVYEVPSAARLSPSNYPSQPPAVCCPIRLLSSLGYNCCVSTIDTLALSCIKRERYFIVATLFSDPVHSISLLRPKKTVREERKKEKAVFASSRGITLGYLPGMTSSALDIVLVSGAEQHVHDRARRTLEHEDPVRVRGRPVPVAKFAEAHGLPSGYFDGLDDRQALQGLGQIASPIALRHLLKRMKASSDDYLRARSALRKPLLWQEGTPFPRWAVVPSKPTPNPRGLNEALTCYALDMLAMDVKPPKTLKAAEIDATGEERFVSVNSVTRLEGMMKEADAVVYVCKECGGVLTTTFEQMRTHLRSKAHHNVVTPNVPFDAAHCNPRGSAEQVRQRAKQMSLLEAWCELSKETSGAASKKRREG